MLHTPPRKKPTYNYAYTFARLQHRVIDSDAYASLSFSAKSLLVELVRQLRKVNNNGRLVATPSTLKARGFGSQNTVYKCIRELIAKNLLYRTRQGGLRTDLETGKTTEEPSLYALTFEPLTRDKDGLYLGGFAKFEAMSWVSQKK